MRVEELERELRAERQQLEPDFARRLDDWAAAGFPRDGGFGPLTGRGGGGRLRRAWERISSTPPRRMLLPAGAVATAVVIAGVAISRDGEIGGSRAQRGPNSTSLSNPPLNEASGRAGSGAGASAPPAARPVVPDTTGGGIARGTEDRLVDSTARLTLGTDASDVQSVADQVVAVTDRYQGIVIDSQVTSDQAGARAAFTLEIPAKQLDAALADLSGLADVISRTQSGHDITARAVRARKRLAATLDDIRKARIDLIQADTREQRLVIRARVESLQADANVLQTRLAGVKREARFATVAVGITSSSPGSSSGDGGWTLSSALDDAGHVLEVIGAIALVSLAVLAPVSLLVALGWLIASRVRRRRRETTLDG